MEAKFISGFSKLSKDEKLKIISSGLQHPENFIEEIESLNHRQPGKQSLLDQFSENTLGNFPLPFGVAPNFLINGRYYIIPMVTEESSVVAAAASAARFWSDKGGFHSKVIGTIKIGQVHFCWIAKKEILLSSFTKLKKYLLENTEHLTRSMVERGGGIREIELIDFTAEMENYFQLRVMFETADSMGANFINSVLEEMALLIKGFYSGGEYSGLGEAVEIIMAILSNYTPGCIVECYIETRISSFEKASEDMSGKEFVKKFSKAMEIAEFDPYRAVTHNKGIFNGIDAVVLATANDFRAAEAAGHAYAARTGRYRSLSKVEINGDVFRMSLEVPLAVGTIGGLTSLHPMAKWSFELLNQPGAEDLMMIMASAGLASNFSAIRSLITNGIQKGHMKLHLANILSTMNADAQEKIKASAYFEHNAVSYQEVKKFLDKNRQR